MQGCIVLLLSWHLMEGGWLVILAILILVVSRYDSNVSGTYDQLAAMHHLQDSMSPSMVTPPPSPTT
jgi:hypothetical protein